MSHFKLWRTLLENFSAPNKENVELSNFTLISTSMQKNPDSMVAETNKNLSLTSLSALLSFAAMKWHDG